MRNNYERALIIIEPDPGRAGKVRKKPVFTKDNYSILSDVTAI
jgi:hypothetical protein